MALADRWLYGWGLGYVAIGAASVLVPVYALALGAGPFLVGLLASTAAFAGVPGALLWGRLAERSGRRRPFVLFALLAAAFLLAGMSFVARPLVLLALNAALWFVVAAAAPVCNLAMVEGVPGDRWDDQLATLNAVQGYGWVVGLLLGTAWLGLAGTASPTAAQRSLLLLLAGVALVATALVSVLFREETRPEVSQRRLQRRFGRLATRDLGAGRVIRLLPLGPGRVYWSLRRFDLGTLRSGLTRTPGTFLAGTALFATGSAVFWGPMPAYLDANGLATTAIFAVFLVGNLGSAVTYGRVAVVEPVVGARRIQLAGIASRAVLFPATVLLAGGAVLLLGVVLGLIGVSWAMVAVTGPLLVSRLVPAAERPAALATYTALSSAGTGVGSVLGGALAAAAGYLVAYSVAGGLVLVGLVSAWYGLAGSGEVSVPESVIDT